MLTAHDWPQRRRREDRRVGDYIFALDFLQTTAGKFAHECEQNSPEVSQTNGSEKTN
jgi:hypothetical protein